MRKTDQGRGKGLVCEGLPEGLSWRSSGSHLRFHYRRCGFDPDRGTKSLPHGAAKNNKGLTTDMKLKDALFLGRKAVTNLASIFKSRNITNLQRPV